MLARGSGAYPHPPHAVPGRSVNVPIPTHLHPYFLLSLYSRTFFKPNRLTLASPATAPSQHLPHKTGFFQYPLHDNPPSVNPKMPLPHRIFAENGDLILI